MAWFRNLKVKAKMIVCFMVVIAMMAGLSVFAFIQLDRVSDGYQYAIEHPMSSEMNMSRFISAIRDMRRASATMGMFAPQNDPAKIESYYQGGVAAYNEGMAALNEIEANVRTDKKASDAVINDVAGVVGDLRDTFQRYMDTFCNPVHEAALVGDYEATLVYAANVAPLANELNEKADALIAICIENAEGALVESAASVRLTKILIVAVAVLAALIAVSIALYVAGVISGPIKTITGFMKQAGETGDISLRPEDIINIEKLSKNKDEIGDLSNGTASFVQHVAHISQELDTVASGDLTTKIELLSDADVMGKALVHMVHSLNTLFGEINQSTAQVASGAKQVADGSQSLAQGSTEQASSIEQLSASISEIAQKTKDNADKAVKAAALANTIKGNAEKGSQQMDEMTAAVKEINAASQSIQKVIKVIDDIAFQTNILALNAAVEAARAGQHGKGFAVVAEEVRNLAAKSAEAAKDTGGLIANSMEKAELGTRIANDTAASLEEIVQGINESSQIVNEIAQSSNEQTAGINHINQGIDQVASVVQQNSATAEQSAAASEEMSGQSALLEELVAQFKLKDEGRRVGSRPARGAALPTAADRRLTMPEKTSYSQNGGGDFGKY